MQEGPQMPSARQMMLRGALLIALLIFGLTLGTLVGQVAVWIAGALALYWLIRELLPLARRHRRS